MPADLRISELGEVTTPLTTDVLPIVSGGATKKITTRNLARPGEAGWIDATDETWTYASATTFTVPTDLTALFPIGAKIRLKQGGAFKYFSVVAAGYGAPNTTVVVTGGSIYSLANAAITDNAYSYVATPQGFPGFFNYVAVWSAVGGTPPAIGNGTLTGRFRVIGGVCTYTWKLIFGSTSTYGVGNSWWTVTLPLNSSNDFVASGVASHPSGGPYAFGFGQGGVLGDTGLWYPTSAGGGLVVQGTPATCVAGDTLRLSGEYLI